MKTKQESSPIENASSTYEARIKLENEKKSYDALIEEQAEEDERLLIHKLTQVANENIAHILTDDDALLHVAKLFERYAEGFDDRSMVSGFKAPDGHILHCLFLPIVDEKKIRDYESLHFREMEIPIGGQIRSEKHVIGLVVQGKKSSSIPPKNIAAARLIIVKEVQNSMGDSLNRANDPLLYDFKPDLLKLIVPETTLRLIFERYGLPKDLKMLS